MKNRLKSLTDRTFRLIFPATEKLLEMAYRNRIANTVIRKPVIVIGPERSGTSLVYSLLANHPDVYALTTAANRYPDHPLSASMTRRILSAGANEDYRALPNTTGAIKGGGRFTLTEAIDYWERHLRSRKGSHGEKLDDSFSEGDLDEDTRRRLPLDLAKRLAVMKKPRLVVKQPGFSLKIGYLNALFPDAIFVHCLRNPLDNLKSLLDRKQHTGNPNWGLRIPGWQQYAGLPIETQTAHQLAGTYEIIQQSIQQIGGAAGRYVPVRYEAFEADYATEVCKLFHGCELPPPPAVLQNPQNYVRPGGKRNERQNPLSDPAAREILEKLGAQMGYKNIFGHSQPETV